MVAGAALTAALALAALPGIAGSAGPTPATTIDPTAFQSIQIQAFSATALAAEPLDSVYAAAGQVDRATSRTEPGRGVAVPLPTRPRVQLPEANSGSAPKPPRYRMTGYASF